jgi:pSer/pThr/pTyr-binding forkhead associated (FHA) protein
MPRLIEQAGGAGGQVHPLERGKVVLGREPACDIVLDGEGISRRHAELVGSREGWRIVDLGSRNGTFVNDERVESAALNDGDRIRCGPVTELEFRDGDEAVAAAATPPAPARARRGPVDLVREWHAWLLPAGEGEAFELAADVTLVGRDPAGGLRIEDSSVSRHHARLDRRGGTLTVTDLKSRNGTRVNGEPVLQAPLHDGDRVEFGTVEYEVALRPGVAWRRLLLAAGAALAAIALVAGLKGLGDWMGERADASAMERRLRSQALFSVQRGIDAHRRGDFDYARGYLNYAGELLLLSDLAPRGASLDRPAELFREIARDLPPGDRDFDFARSLDPRAVTGVRLEELSDRDYVERQIRRIAIELGQDENIPEGFIDQVWAYVQDSVRYPGKFQGTLRRAQRIHPRMRQILAEAHLPEVFCYVAWTESDLESGAVSPAGARGLWQFMAPTGRQYGLAIDPARGIDERQDVAASTRAATKYIGNLIRTFGREQFMCALASYNRGENGVRAAMEKIPDPMMQSSRKYWYLVEHRLLPRETGEYVSRIFTAAVLASDPKRFGFEES